MPQQAGEEAMVRLFIGLAVGVAWLGAVAPAPASAQEWPARPVRIIVPLAPGGGGDVFARLLGEELAKRLGQPFVVENRPGGALNIGMRACAESPPDGYTLCLTSSEPIVTNQFLYKSMPFNAETDFEAITLLFFNPIALVTNNTLGVKTIAELVALSKARPGTLSYASFSFPAIHFMDGLKKTAGADWVYVPYRSGNEVVNAVVTGATPVAFLGLANTLGQLRSGLITGIALNAHARSPLFPDLPTLTEAGAEDFPPAWFGLFAPRGAPKTIMARLHAEIVRITGEPAWRQKNFIDRAIVPAVNTPEQFAEFIVRERKIAERIVRESGQQPQ
jgi:tripartite-type tricarboxylate transporter receptor subunit TctC